MPKSTAICFFDSTISITSSADPYDDLESFYPVSPGGAFFQFNLPALEEINLSSARLFFYVINRGVNTSIRVQLYNWFKSLEGASRGTYDAMRDENAVAWADDEYAVNAQVNGYNQYVSLDITELVIGYLGRNYYTLGLISKRTSGSSNYDHTKISMIEGGHAAYIELTYDYATPFKPTIVYPAGDAISNQGTLTFQWKYSSSGTTGQKKFDLQWKMQSDNTWNMVTQTTSSTSYSIDASSFTNGIVEWRVRTYNLHNMASEWSQSQFVVIGKPGNPVISGVKNDSITEITWNANKAEESAARIRILKSGAVIYDSGVIPAGIEDIHKPDIMLDNGSYIALLSISNMYDMWSNEISYPFTINNTKPATPIVGVVGMGDYIRLSYASVSEAEYFIFRAEENKDFVPIARTFDNQYDDYAVKSGIRYRYFVRSYSKAYADSQVKDVSTKYNGYIFSLVCDMAARVLFFFHETEERIPFQKSISLDTSLVFYSGRKKPVKETGIHEKHDSV